MNYVTHMIEACYTNKWVMSHIWISHFACMEESCHTYEWVIHMNESCHFIWISPVTHINDSSHMYFSCVWRQSIRCCSTAHSCGNWVHTSCGVYLLHLHIWMRHVARMNGSCYTFEWGMPADEWGMLHIWMSHVTQSIEALHIYKWVTSNV